MPVDRLKHMHAKGETVDVLRTFKDSFATRRGILPIRSFGRWRAMRQAPIVRSSLARANSTVPPTG